jgi:hypothetical protein
MARTPIHLGEMLEDELDLARQPLGDAIAHPPTREIAMPTAVG